MLVKSASRRHKDGACGLCASRSLLTQGKESGSLMQSAQVARLESELQIEREAHERTLRDAEATLMELEGIRGMDAGQSEAFLSLQEELTREKHARREAAVELDDEFGPC